MLAAHGSLAAEDSNQPLFELADRISQQQKFATVTPAFLMGDPLMSNVLERLPVGDVIIVPVMTSEGYYLKKLPGKFGENPNCNDYRLFMSRVVGVHDAIPTIVANRVLEKIAQFDLQAAETTIVVVGHGTRRNKTSGDTTYRLAEAVEKHVAAKGVDQLTFNVGFLDQDPPVEEIAAAVKTRNTLVVPFLMSRGPHMTEDVTEAFGLESGAHVQFPLLANNSNGGLTVCESPMATYSEMADICVEFAEQAINQDALLELSVGEPS